MHVDAEERVACKRGPGSSCRRKRFARAGPEGLHARDAKVCRMLSLSSGRTVDKISPTDPFVLSACYIMLFCCTGIRRDSFLHTQYCAAKPPGYCERTGHDELPHADIEVGLRCLFFFWSSIPMVSPTRESRCRHELAPAPRHMHSNDSSSVYAFSRYLWHCRTLWPPFCCGYRAAARHNWAEQTYGATFFSAVSRSAGLLTGVYVF